MLCFASFFFFETPLSPGDRFVDVAFFVWFISIEDNKWVTVQITVLSQQQPHICDSRPRVAHGKVKVTGHRHSVDSELIEITF